MDIWKTLERHLSDIYKQNITLYQKLADKIQYFAAKRRQNSIIATDVKKYCFFLYNTTVGCDCFFTCTDSINTASSDTDLVCNKIIYC